MSRMMTGLRRSRGPLVGVVAFTAVSLFLTMLIAGTLSKGGNGPTVQLKATFADASGLKKGDDVRIAGVRIGQVKNVALAGSRALVTMEIARSQPVYDSTVAKIDFLNIMGQRYVELTKTGGSQERLADGSTIPIERTEQGLDLTAMFNAFKPLFELIKPADVNQLATNIVGVLQGQGGALQNLTDQTAQMTSTLLDRDEVIGAVIDNVTSVMGTLQTRRVAIGSMITQLNGLTRTVADNKVQLGNTLDGVSSLVASFSELTTSLGPTIDADIGALQGWAAAFARQSPGIASTLTDVQMLLGGYVKTLGLGSFLNTYVCKTALQLGAGGPVVPINPSPQNSKRCR